jgi:hypothetical protein
MKNDKKPYVVRKAYT